MKTQFTSYTFIYNPLQYAYENPDKVRLKIFYYPLEETKEEMKTFKELKNDVYEIAQTKFGQLTDEVRQRLDSELDGIEKYGRAELFVTLRQLFMDLSEKDICVKLRPLNGYNVSLVSYLLGISLFNPMEHPNLITERYVLNTLREVSGVDLRIDVNKPEMIVQLVYDYGYEYAR